MLTDHASTYAAAIDALEKLDAIADRYWDENERLSARVAELELKLAEAEHRLQAQTVLD